MNLHFAEWRRTSAETLGQLTAGCHPKEIIAALSENLFVHDAATLLIDSYDVYQHLMDYWAETMQDDCYLIAADGWKAETYRILEKNNKDREKDKGWNCDRQAAPAGVCRGMGGEAVGGYSIALSALYDFSQTVYRNWIPRLRCQWCRRIL
ncbi:MAG: hypothetical protein ACRESZ_18445 [Methylococcales bacterium]